MAQYQITLDPENLHHLFLKNSKDEGLGKLLESILNQVLQVQASEQLMADPYERNEERQGYRNGSYPHKITTRVGTLTLKIPRLRNGKFSSEMFMRYQRSEQALILAMMEMVVNGVSTRKVENITSELCGTEFKKSTVSDLCRRLDPIVEAWRHRPFNSWHPFLIVDAMVIKVREDDRVRPRSFLIATGVSEEGYREILGFSIGDSESEESWSQLFQSLKSRGLKTPDFIVSDQHGGLVKAARKYFQGATWQRCQTHFMRNIITSTPKNRREELLPKLRAIFQASDLKSARLLKNELIREYQDITPKAMETLDEGFDDATSVLDLPEKYRKRLRTTNGSERLNEEVRRRERVIRIFPNRESAIRLLGALLMDIDDAWTSGKKYLDMQEYLEQREQRKTKGQIAYIGKP